MCEVIQTSISSDLLEGSHIWRRSKFRRIVGPNVGRVFVGVHNSSLVLPELAICLRVVVAG